MRGGVTSLATTQTGKSSQTNVSVTSNSTKKIDINLIREQILTGGVKGNYHNFQDRLEEELRKKGVNTSHVSFTEIESREVFPFDPQNFSNYCEGNGHGYYFDSAGYNNRTFWATPNIWPHGTFDKNFHCESIYTDNDLDKSKLISINYEITELAPILEGAVLLNSTIHGDGLEGYLFGIRGRPSSGRGRAFHTFLSKVYFPLDAPTKEIKLRSFSIVDDTVGRVGSYIIESTPEAIIIKDQSGRVKHVEKIQQNPGSSIGFSATGHPLNEWQNAERAYGYLRIDVNKIEKYIAGGMLRGIDKVERKTNSERVVVHLGGQDNNGMNQNETREFIANKMLDGNTHYIGWSDSTNKNQMDSLLEKSNGKGVVKTGNFNENIEATATYIAQLVENSKKTDADTFETGDQISFTPTPENTKNNTTDSEYPNGKWHFDFEPIFESSPPNVPDAGKYFDAIPDSQKFVQPGKYTLKYAEQTVKQFTVHSTPVADFDATLADSPDGSAKTISYTENSFDPDFKTQPDKGIVQKEWSYRDTNTGQFTVVADKTALPTTLDKTYQIRLRVKDSQGVWSPYEVKLLSPTIVEPMADFSLQKDTLYDYETQAVTNKSYTTNGSPITSYRWEIKKNNNTLQTYNTENIPAIDFSDSRYGAGNYSLSLTINANGKESTVTKKFTVKTDDLPPNVSYPTIQSTSTDITQNRLTATPDVFSDNNPKSNAITIKPSSTVRAAGDKFLLEESVWGTGANIKADGTLDIQPTFVGKRNLPIIFADSAGNQTTVNIEVEIVDDIDPTISITGDWNIDTSTETKLPITTSDNSGKTPTVTVDDGSTLPKGLQLAKEGENWYLTGTTVDAGEHHFTLKATDEYGNTATVTHSIIITDRTPPVFGSMTAPFTVGTTNDSTPDDGVEITVPVTDDVGVTTLELTINPFDNTPENTIKISGTNKMLVKALKPGTYTGSLTAKDAANNQKTQEFTLQVNDETPPTFTKNRIDETADTTSAHSFDVEATDNSGQNPTLSLTQGHDNSISMTGNTVTIQTKTPGNYDFSIKAVDGAGNETTIPATITVKDTTAPTVTVTPASYTTNSDSSNITVTPTITDNSTDPLTLTLENVGDTEGLPESLEFDGTTGIISGSPTQPGIYIYRIKATDLSSNNGYSQDITITVNDTTKPTIENLPSSGTIISANTSGIGLDIRPAIIDNDKKNSLTIELIDPVTGQPITDPNTWLPDGVTFDPTDGSITGSPASHVPPKTYTFKIKVTDKAGNSVTSDPITFNVVDTTLPEIQLQPEYIFPTGEQIEIQPTVTDNSGIWSYQQITHNMPSDISEPQIVGSEAGKIVGTSRTPGEYNITFIVQDGAGNNTTKSTKLVLQDKTAPIMNATPHGTTGTVTANTIAFTTGSDDGLEYDLNIIDPENSPITFTLDGAPKGVSITSDGILRFAKAIQPGVHDFLVKATDNADNTLNVAVQATIEDNTKPELVVPAVTTFDNASPQIKFNISARDNDSNFKPKYSAQNLPSWLHLNQNTGEVFGQTIGVEVKDYHITWEVEDNNGNKDSKQSIVRVEQKHYSSSSGGYYFPPSNNNPNNPSDPSNSKDPNNPGNSRGSGAVIIGGKPYDSNGNPIGKNNRGNNNGSADSNTSGKNGDDSNNSNDRSSGDTSGIDHIKDDGTIVIKPAGSIPISVKNGTVKISPSDKDKGFYITIHPDGIAYITPNKNLSPGTYRIKLIIIDKDGNTITIDLVIEILEKTGLNIYRLGGATRVETAVKVSQDLYPGGNIENIVLARSDLFADAVTGTPYAKEHDAPVLLTPSAHLHDTTKNELLRLRRKDGKTTVHIMGGKSAISAQTEQTIKDLGFEIVRIDGSNRFDTAKKIHEHLGAPSQVAVVDGGDQSLAVVAGTAMSKIGGSVLFSSDGKIPVETKLSLQKANKVYSYLDTKDNTGIASINTDSKNLLVKHIEGASPQQMSIQTDRIFFQNVDTIVISHVDRPIDAVVGGTYAAHKGTSLILTDNRLDDTLDWAVKNGKTSVVIIGGEKAIKEK